jgi:hypothetical protein
MIPIKDSVLTRLRLEEAVHNEAQSWQSLIPAAPGWDQVDTKAAECRLAAGKACRAIRPKAIARDSSDTNLGICGTRNL